MQGWLSMNSIVTPSVRRGFWATFLGTSTGKHVADSWWYVHTLACHDVRDSASVGCVQWCHDSSKSTARRFERSTLSVVIRGLPLFGLSCTSCVSLYRSRSLDMVLWLTTKSTATSRCFHPASKWPMALARSTLDNFTIFTDQHVCESFVQPQEHVQHAKLYNLTHCE